MKSTHLAYKEEAGKIAAAYKSLWFFLVSSASFATCFLPVFALKHSAYYWLLCVPTVWRLEPASQRQRWKGVARNDRQDLDGALRGKGVNV